MALDDFDDDESKGALEAEGEASEIDWDDPLNEDLFDFALPSPAPEATRESAPSEPRAPLPEPSAAQAETRPPARTSPAELLAQKPAAPRPPSAPPAGSIDHATPPTSPRSTFHDPVLDVDLFAFPDVFVGSDAVMASAKAGAEALAAARERGELEPRGARPHAAPPVGASAAVRPAAAAGAPTAAGRAGSGAAGRPAPPERGRSEDAEGGRYEDFDELVLSAPLAVAPLPIPARGRSLELLALLFLVVNTGLVLFAWQANASFHDTLTEVTRTVGETIASQAKAGAASSVILAPAPPSGAALPTLDEEPSDVAGLQLQSVELGRRMLSEGRFIDARVLLYRLLASADAAGLDPNLVTEAEFLIAESYELQGRALAEAE